MKRSNTRILIGAVAAVVACIHPCALASPPDARAGIAAEEDRPARSVEAVLEGVDHITRDEAIALVRHLGGAAVHVINSAGDALLLGAGVGMSVSKGEGLHNESRDGVWWFPAGGVVMLRDDLGIEPVVIAPGDVVIVGVSLMGDDLPAPGAIGSVHCASGYYACCDLNPMGKPRAVCIPNGQNPQRACVSGGPGATACSISHSGIINLVTPEP